MPRGAGGRPLVTGDLYSCKGQRLKSKQESKVEIQVQEQGGGQVPRRGLWPVISSQPAQQGRAGRAGWEPSSKGTRPWPGGTEAARPGRTRRPC